MVNPYPYYSQNTYEKAVYPELHVGSLRNMPEFKLLFIK